MVLIKKLPEFWIVPSLYALSNVYFLFRDTGEEVKIQIRNKKVFSNKYLESYEIEYIKKNILCDGHEISKFKLMNFQDQYV